MLRVCLRRNRKRIPDQGGTMKIICGSCFNQMRLSSIVRVENGTIRMWYICEGRTLTGINDHPSRIIFIEPFEGLNFFHVEGENTRFTVNAEVKKHAINSLHPKHEPGNIVTCNASDSYAMRSHRHRRFHRQLAACGGDPVRHFIRSHLVDHLQAH